MLTPLNVFKYQYIARQKNFSLQFFNYKLSAFGITNFPFQNYYKLTY